MKLVFVNVIQVFCIIQIGETSMNLNEKRCRPNEGKFKLIAPFKNATWEDANSICHNFNSFLFEGPLPCENFTLNNLGNEIWIGVKKVNDFYQKFGPQPELFSLPELISPVAEIWWMTGHPKYDCMAINLQNDSFYGSFLTIPCSEQRSFLCADWNANEEKYEPKHEISEVKIEISPLKLKPILLKDKDEIRLRCRATGLVNGKRRELTKQGDNIRYAWSKEGVFIDKYDKLFSPYLIAFKPYFKNSNIIYTAQGNFRCYVFIPGHKGWLPSPEVTVKFKDIFTMLITIINGVKFDESKSGYSAIEHQRFAENILQPFVDEFLSNSAENPLFPLINWDISAMWKNREYSTDNVRIIAFFNASQANSYMDINRVMGYLERKADSINYRLKKIKFDIRQTEYCNRVYSEFEKFFWPETKTMSANYSTPLCLSRNMEFHSRSCDLSFRSGAQWRSAKKKCYIVAKDNFFDDFDEPSLKNYLSGKICMNSFWKKGNGCIWYSNQAMNWSMARSTCSKYFSSIANDYFRPDVNGNDKTWIDKQVFRWFRGSNRNLYKWKSDEEPKFDEHCKVVESSDYKMRPYELSSENCQQHHPFFCHSLPNAYELTPVKSVGNKKSVLLLMSKIYEFVTTEKRSYEKASVYCEKYNGRLISLPGEAVIRPLALYLLELFQASTDDQHTFWMGLRKLDNGSYIWSDGKPLVYQMWHKNVTFSSINRYGLITFTKNTNKIRASLNWKLRPSHEENFFICEYDIDGTKVDEELTKDLDDPKIQLKIIESQRIIQETNNGFLGNVFQEIQCKVNGLVPSSIIFHKDGAPFFSNTEKVHPNKVWNNLYSTGNPIVPYLQGYYWCTAKAIFGDEYISSPKVLITLPSSSTLVCYLEMKKTVKFTGWHRKRQDELYWDLLTNYTREIKRFVTTFLYANEMSTGLVFEVEIKEMGYKSDQKVTFIAFNIYYSRIIPSKRKKRQAELGFWKAPDVRSISENILKKCSHINSNGNEDIGEYINEAGSGQCAWYIDAQVDPQSISVRYSDECVDDQTIDTRNNSIKLSWKSTPIGTTIRPNQLCMTSTGDPVIRRCLGNFTTGAYWGKVIGSCEQNVSNITLQLIQLKKLKSSKNTVATKLLNLSSQLPLLQTIDIGIIAEVVQKFTLNPIDKTNVVEDIISSVDNVLSLNQSRLFRSQHLVNSSMQFIQSLNAIMGQMQLSKNDKSFSFSASNIAVEVWNISSGEIDPVIGVSGISSSGNSDKKIKLKTLRQSSDEDYNNTNAAIILPKNLLEDWSKLGEKSDDVRVSFLIYEAGKFFKPMEEAENHDKEVDDPLHDSFTHILNTAVISASFHSHEIMELDPPLKLIFNPMKKSNGDINDKSSCVYWDMEANGNTGGWSTKGCKLKEIIFGKYICQCNHLTNFAVIVDLYGQKNNIAEEHSKILSIITYIGCTLSIIGLLLTIVTFALFKKWRKSLTNQIHVNLALALLLSVLVFVLGTRKSWHPIHHTCIAVAMLLHYFLLSSFIWMLIEAIKHYLFFVAYMKSYVPNFMTKAMIVAWGIPLIIVVLTVSIDHELYVGGDLYCWMALRGFYFSFLLPMGVIMLTNILLFIRVIYSLAFDRQRKKLKLRTNQPSQKDVRIRFYAALGIFILSGSTWIFAFFAVSNARILFQYLFCIANSLQGFFIFFLMVFKERSARSFWENKLLRCFNGKGHEDGTVQYSSSGTRSRSYDNKTGVTSTAIYASSSSSGTANSGIRFFKKNGGVQVIPS